MPTLKVTPILLSFLNRIDKSIPYIMIYNTNSAITKWFIIACGYSATARTIKACLRHITSFFVRLYDVRVVVMICTKRFTITMILTIACHNSIVARTVSCVSWNIKKHINIKDITIALKHLAHVCFACCLPLSKWWHLFFVRYIYIHFCLNWNCPFNKGRLKY